MAAGFFISKAVGVVCIVLAVGAVATIIALSVVYAQEKNKTASSGGDTNTNTTTTSAPTTAAPNNPWNRWRLPTTLKPELYDVTLQPFLTPDNNNMYIFKGNSSVTFTCEEPTDLIIIHSNKLNYTMQGGFHASLQAVGSTEVPTITKTWLETTTQYLVVQLDRTLTKGQSYVLSSIFTGELADDLAGFYRSEYVEGNVTKVVATTQMQAPDARKAFPCFDEPAMKANFTVTLIHPSDHEALSNMPIESTEEVQMDGESWNITRFATTPKMSTYLLAFIVSEFTEVSNNSEEVLIRIWGRPQAISEGQGAYALQVTGPILKFFEQHYNTAYPLPKSDQVALPDFNAGAMENWGLVTYRENSLLFDGNYSSVGNKERVVTVIAHELAHQWFGNLVTLRWWNDLWLNEGFASYVEYLGADSAEPSWNIKDLMVLNELYTVMATDALTTSHPLSFREDEINTPAQISEVFDSIAYSKGASVLRMLSDFLTEDVFKEGLQSYLHTYAYGNTVYTDLWEHLQKAVDNRNVSLPGNISTIMDRWTLQMGFPVVTVDTNTGRIQQKHFLLDPTSTVERPSDFNYTWIVPITWMTSRTNGSRYWLVEVSDTNSTFKVDSSDWLLLNLNVSGYFRVNYNQENWDQLLWQLSEDHLVIPVINRAQIIDDAFNLARAKYVDVTLALNTTQFLSQETEYMPWQAALNNLQYFQLMFDRSEVFGVMRSYIQKQVKPLFEHYKNVTGNWTDVPPGLMDQYNEVNAISTACSYGIPECQELGRNGQAWLACGPQLEVVNSVTGERLSAYRFSGVNDQPPTVRVVKEFSWQKRAGLLVGLEEAEGSVLCLYDLGISRVVKAVVLPGRVTGIEPIINHGGASVSTQHLHQSLRWLFGVAAVVTDVGHVLLVDLCLDDLSCSQNEVEASDLEVVTGIPAEVPQRREAVTREGRHLCFQVQNPSGTAVTTLCYISRSNLLAVGFSDGYLSLWNMKTLKKEYHSQLEGGRIPVYAVTFQEPENDPRNCCYLWAVQSTQESEGDVLSLHLLQLAFGDRKRLASGQVMYEGFEYCDERYSLDLTGGAFPLRGQSSNTKLLSCQTVEKFRNHVDREDSINEVISPDTSVSIFSWQVNTYGQGKPSTYLGVFDINRWYHAQMPDSLRPEEFLYNCPYFALWSLDTVISMTSPNRILDILVHERSLSRGVPPSYPPPEQFFNPSTYNFDGTCLLNSGVVHMTCTGFQKETLNFLKKSGPSISEAICDSYNRCLIAGLLSPRLVDVQPSSLSQEEQLEAVLSAAVQTSSLELLTGCIKHWTSEEQPSSAASLRFVLEWTWNKVIYTKDELDQICVPLFDGSCNFIDPQTIQSLQHCQLVLNNLSTVLNCFLAEAQELTEKGVTDLTNKQMVTSLISLYAQVIIWFCRSSLLPEGLDDDMHLSRPFYNYPLIQSYYTGHRQKLERLSRGKWDSDCLMIDAMVSQLGEQVEKLWRRDEGGTGRYPPVSLHALLDLYLLENIEENDKHAITIYLLLDIMHSIPNKTETSIDSFPTVFAIPWGLVRLIQGFWLLDHNDYENSLALLFHPATIKTVSWQHMRIIQSLMCQGEHRRALKYMQMMKPSVSSSSEVQLFVTVLLSNRCMVEAWSLLQQHSTKLNVEELLRHMYELCQEMGLMQDLLKLPFTDSEQECLEKFLQTNGGVQNHEFLLVHHLQRANYIPALQLNQSMKVNLMHDCDSRLKERAVTRNSILDQYGKILPRVQRKLAMERAKPYHLPSSVLREVSRPKPLSTVAKKANAESVHTRATFISDVFSKIGEVWVGNEQKNSFAQDDSPRVTEPPVIMNQPLPDAELPEAFIGTPITKFSQKCSRLLDSVVRPVPSCSPAQDDSWQSPCLPSTSHMASSPLKSNIRGSIPQRRIARASELGLLETPLVVKRAKVLVTSAAAPGFPGFTPQSILRSSLRTTPLATPSASPGRSVTPPLRAKELRISFREENSNVKWTVGVTEDDKAQSGASSEHHRRLVEDAWSECREKTPLFTLRNPEDGHAEMEESLESTPGGGLEKMDVSKENSNVSARSDQTTLEYHDAKSPGDFEDDVIFIAAKPANSFTEETADFQEPEREDRGMGEDKPFQIEQTDSSEPRKEAGYLEESTTECPTFPEDGKFVFKAAEAAASWTANEGETNHQEPKMASTSEERDILPVVNPQLSESPEADSESVISILDSEDVVSTHSENRLEGKYVDLPEERNLDEIEENLPFVQEEMHVSNNLPKPEEIHVLEDDAVNAQASEEAPEMSPCSELRPSGNLQYSYDAIEQQFACDLPDNKDDECDAAEGDGELFISQSNFTLVLEGEEGEGEMGDPELVDTSKPAVNTTDEKPMNSFGNTENEEHVTNSVSTVTSDQESQNIAESLPYVPEPIKVAIAENLLDVIKDTRSKEFTSEVVEQSIHESIGKKVTRMQRSKSSLTTVPEGVEDETSIHQVEYVVTPRSRPRRQLNRSLVIPSSGDQQLLKTDKPVLFGLSPRRSTRRTKEAPETSSLLRVENTQDEQIPVTPVTPRRGRKPKQTNLEKVASSQSDGQTLSSSTQSIATTPRRGLRRVKEAASELLEEAKEETSLAEGSIITSATSRRTRGGKRSAGDQETGQTGTDLRIKPAVSPSRSIRKLKSSNSQPIENTVVEQEVQPSDQLLLPVPTKRGRRRKTSSSDLSENSDLDLSKSSVPQTELKLPVTPRRSVRKLVRNLSADIESASTQEDIPSGEKVEVVDTPRRRARRVAHAKPEKTDALERTPEQPNEQSTTPRTAVRTGGRGRKRQLPSILEESTGEEAFPQGPDGSPLLLTDVNTSGYDEASRTLTDRITRSRKTSVHQKLSVEENESFLFSPPLTKLSKKVKAGKADHPVQLKDLDPDLSSQFVFSPPLLRSRRKNVSSISRIVKEPELPSKEEEDTKSIESVGKQKSKRGRTAKSKANKTSKTTRKEGSWSPPPVEIQFISPFTSPVDGKKSKQKETTDATEKNLRKNKKRLSNFPKPVVRRKML